jgi:outer membrane protein
MQLPLLRPLSFALLFALGGQAAAADLLQAYQLARESDPQLSAAESQRLATGEGVVQSRAALLPQISGSASLSDSDSTSTSFSAVPDENGDLVFGRATTDSDSRSRSYGVDLQQSLYSHANYTRLRASRARSAAAEADLDAALDGLALRVAQAYFGVLTSIDTLAFARADERAVKRQLDQAEQRFEVGLTAVTDVHEARARYDSSRASAITAENALDDAREALAEITGTWMENFKGLEDGFVPVLPEPSDLTQWVDIALAESPTLRGRTLALDAAEQDIATARAGHLPSLSAFVSYDKGAGWGDRVLSSGFNVPANSENDGTTIGLSLNVPIFAGGATQSAVRQAVYGRDAVADQLEQQRRAVTRTTRNAYRAVLAGISEIEARKQALVSAQSALEATEAGFEVGTRTIVDVLLSQQVLTQAQRDYSNSRHNFLVNTLALKQSAGVIDVKDVEAVNRLLTRDAEAALAAVADEAR